MIKFWT